ncbi:chorismate-binding protein, partial [Staphylococcus epidermidis]|uniref:chorismate-binding protein n=1 Tax=Staphylococcus epidermidis TaxID=1282 RepID=UPI0016434EFD
LFSIHKYHTVFQITSTLSGQLQHHIQLIHIIPPLFPSPSITAPPKINTIQYIPHFHHIPTSIYSPTIPLLLPNQTIIFNIPIPTIQYNHQEPLYPVPPPITIHSIPQNQLQQYLLTQQHSNNINQLTN